MATVTDRALTGTVLAAGVATVVLAWRDGHRRAIEAYVAAKVREWVQTAFGTTEHLPADDTPARVLSWDEAVAAEERRERGESS